VGAMTGSPVTGAAARGAQNSADNKHDANF